MKWRAPILFFLIILSFSNVLAYANSQEIASVEESEPSIPYPYSLFWREIYPGFIVWSMEYFNEVWILRNDLLNVSNIPEDRACKTFLSIQSEEAGSYRITFRINLDVLNYSHQENSYNLTYREHKLFFDWSDIANLVFVGETTIIHGIEENQFYFRIQRNDFPAYVTVITDPVTVVDTSINSATRERNQRKVFRNPRGLKWYYLLLYYHNTPYTTYELRIYRSETGEIWDSGDYQTVKVCSSSSYGSSSLWTYDNSSFLLVYITYHIGDDILYRRGTIEDSSSSITLESEQTVFNGNVILEPYMPVITLANDGYVWISYFLWNSTAAQFLYVDGFTATFTQWTEVGASPYLDAVDNPTNIISGLNNGFKEGNFTYANSTILPASVTLWFYSKGDGNDYFEIHLYNGVWQYIGDIIPNNAYSWKSKVVTAWLNTLEKLNDAKVYVVKVKTGANHDVDIDASYLKVLTPYTVNTLISTVAYSPSSAQWSNHIIEEVGATLGATTLAPLNSVHDVILFFKYVEKGIVWRRGGAELSWDGSSLSFGVVETGAPANDNPTISSFSCVVDSNNLVHLLHTYSARQRISYWIVGAGFNETIGEVIYSFSDEGALSIDLTASPNVIYLFSEDTTGVFPVINKTIEVFEIYLNHSFSHLASILDNSAGDGLNYLTSSYRDCEEGIQLAYTRATSKDVRFYEYSWREDVFGILIWPLILILMFCVCVAWGLSEK